MPVLLLKKSKLLSANFVLPKCQPTQQQSFALPIPEVLLNTEDDSSLMEIQHADWEMDAILAEEMLVRNYMTRAEMQNMVLEQNRQNQRAQTRWGKLSEAQRLEHTRGHADAALSRGCASTC